jgi:hypothetical protein
LVAFTIKTDPDGIRGGKQYLFSGFFPISAPITSMGIWNGKLQPELWPEIIEQSKVKTHRELGDEYGVSHETIRRVLKGER